MIQGLSKVGCILMLLLGVATVSLNGLDTHTSSNSHSTLIGEYGEIWFQDYHGDHSENPNDAYLFAEELELEEEDTDDHKHFPSELIPRNHSTHLQKSHFCKKANAFYISRPPLYLLLEDFRL